jgi:hypothetical protein
MKACGFCGTRFKDDAKDYEYCPMCEDNMQVMVIEEIETMNIDEHIFGISALYLQDFLTQRDYIMASDGSAEDKLTKINEYIDKQSDENSSYPGILKKEYFIRRIELILEHYDNYKINSEDIISNLEKLLIQIDGLKVEFRLFNESDTNDLKKLVEKKIEDIKNSVVTNDKTEEDEEFTWEAFHKDNNDIVAAPGSKDWKLAEKYKMQHPDYSKSSILIEDVWRDKNDLLCVRYISAFNKPLNWFHYTLENGELTWW